jgi:hypothetical protein
VQGSAIELAHITCNADDPISDISHGSDSGEMAIAATGGVIERGERAGRH